MRGLRLLVLGGLLYVSFTRLHLLPLLTRKLAAAPVTAKSVMRAPDSQQILLDVNRYRRQHGLPPLHYSETCQKAAQIQVEYNAENGTWTHDNPNLPEAGDRLQEVGHEYTSGHQRWAENVVRYTLARDPEHSARWHVFHCYHISPHHDKQMLDPKVTLFGTASILDADGVLYNTEVFAN